MDLLEAMDKKIEAMEAELKAVKTARSILAPVQSGSVPDEVAIEHTQNHLGDTGAIDPDDLGLPSKKVTKKDTLSETVKNVIKRFNKKEFTVNHVVAALSQMGKVTTNEKHYKNRVSGVIRTLTDDGVLERTHKGGGNDPHKYREQEESPQMALVNNEG